MINICRNTDKRAYSGWDDIKKNVLTFLDEHLKTYRQKSIIIADGVEWNLLVFVDKHLKKYRQESIIIADDVEWNLLVFVDKHLQKYRHNNQLEMIKQTA